MKLVYVEWLDHSSFFSAVWRDIEEYDGLGPAKCQSIGWIIKETPEAITIVQSVHMGEDDNHDDRFTGDMCIIKKAIIKMKEIKL